MIFGNKSADSGGFQVGIRVAVALARPVVTGLKGLTVGDASATARREATGGGWETYELPLPAIVGVKEGINLPRYASVPGRLRAKKKEVERIAVGAARPGRPPPRGHCSGRRRCSCACLTRSSQAEVIGRGADAAPSVVDLLEKIGVLR